MLDESHNTTSNDEDCHPRHKCTRQKTKCKTKRSFSTENEMCSFFACVARIVFNREDKLCQIVLHRCATVCVCLCGWPSNLFTSFVRRLMIIMMMVMLFCVVCLRFCSLCVLDFMSLQLRRIFSHFFPFAHVLFMPTLALSSQYSTIFDHYHISVIFSEQLFAIKIISISCSQMRLLLIEAIGRKPYTTNVGKFGLCHRQQKILCIRCTYVFLILRSVCQLEGEKKGKTSN